MAAAMLPLMNLAASAAPVTQTNDTTGGIIAFGFGHVHQLDGVAQFGFDGPRGGNRLFQPPAFAHHVLRGLGVVPERLVLDLGIELLKPLERTVPIEEPAQQRKGSIDLVGVSLRFGAHWESPRVGRVSGLRWP